MYSGKSIVFAGLMLVLNYGCVDQSAQLSETDRLNHWFDEKFEEELSRSPIWMTQLGRKDAYDTIDDFSEEAEIEMLEWRSQSVQAMKANFDYALLTDEAKVSYDLWIFQYEQDKAMVPYRRHQYLFSQTFSPSTYLPSFLINYHTVDNEQDMRAYVSRIREVARAIDQSLQRARLAANTGIRPPYFAYEGVIVQSEKLLNGMPFNNESKDDAPIWADAKRKVAALVTQDKISQATADEILSAANNALLTYFQPSYVSVIEWLQNDRDNVDDVARGVDKLLGGELYYNARLKQQTTTNLSADEIHEIGLREVARLRGEIEEIKLEVGFDGDLQDFFAFVRTDPQFYYANDDTGRQGYLDDSTNYLDYIGRKLPDYFGLLPKSELVVKRVEAFRERDGAAQHYRPGTPDGSRPGVYYAHLSDMRAMSKSTMEAVAYHEGNPGHHMQVSIARELESVPEFRKHTFFASYGEGWALYAELLAKEMGAYESPYSEYGRLTTEIWRAIRLVVDTGIHVRGWSEEQSVSYFEQNSAISMGAIRSEVQRYFVSPGQATAYKIGMIKILELRKKAQSELGDKFDIRAFHDQILGGGSVPLPVLELIIDRWINKMKVDQ